MPNKLTSLYSKIYYKEENYLKVRTTVFKYITPPIVKVKYISILVCVTGHPCDTLYTSTCFHRLSN